MSTLETTDNTMSSESVGSPSRKNRQQANGRKAVATGQLRGKRQARNWDVNRRKIAKFLVKRLNEDNCEQYGISKVEIFRLREVAYGAREKDRRS